jgi:hypothetical protein
MRSAIPGTLPANSLQQTRSTSPNAEASLEDLLRNADVATTSSRQGRFRVQGGYRVYGVGFRVKDVGFRVWV